MNWNVYMIESLDFGTVAILAIMLIVIFSGIRIVRENERYAIFLAERFVGFKGPGLAFRSPGSASTFMRLSISDQGQYMGEGVANFGDKILPVEADDIRPGKIVRIKSFRDNKIWVAPDSSNYKEIVCNKCGHIMKL